MLRQKIPNPFEGQTKQAPPPFDQFQALDLHLDLTNNTGVSVSGFISANSVSQNPFMGHVPTMKVPNPFGFSGLPSPLESPCIDQCTSCSAFDGTYGTCECLMTCNFNNYVCQVLAGKIEACNNQVQHCLDTAAAEYSTNMSNCCSSPGAPAKTDENKCPYNHCQEVAKCKNADDPMMCVRRAQNAKKRCEYCKANPTDEVCPHITTNFQDNNDYVAKPVGPIVFHAVGGVLPPPPPDKPPGDLPQKDCSHMCDRCKDMDTSSTAYCICNNMCMYNTRICNCLAGTVSGQQSLTECINNAAGGWGDDTGGIGRSLKGCCFDRPDSPGADTCRGKLCKDVVDCGDSGGNGVDKQLCLYDAYNSFISCVIQSNFSK